MTTGRNDPCPCGSGKKFKKCCLEKQDSPSHPPLEHRLNTAIAHHQSGQMEEAEAAYRAILDENPGNAATLHLLGVIHFQRGDFRVAADLIGQALELSGPQRDMLYNLGNALRGLRRDREAAEAYLLGLSQAPDDVAILNNLGLAYRDLREYERAAECYTRALAQTPGDVDIQINLGLAHADMHHVEEAIAQYRRALAQAPDRPELCNNLGVALIATGDIEAALPLLEHAVRQRPDYVEAHSNLIFCLDFIERDGTARQQAERRRWATAHTRNIPRYAAHDNLPLPDRPLRIGYVSADFRRHSAAYAFAPLLFDHDRAHFEIFCYSNSTTDDDMTQKMRATATGWRDIYALSDEAAAKQIRQDGIDILVDLAGHARDNRLLVFARKPAPIQATGWGHANGTGMTEIDAIFTDPIVLPPDEASLYAETPVNLPCLLGYMADPDAPQPTPLPSRSSGQVTFGCFSRFSKVTGEALDLWCELLRMLPGSRMIFKSAELNSQGKCKTLLCDLNNRGIGKERIDLIGWTPWHEHLAAMNRVDLMLDTFPHGGGVGVLDGLWMGVPVLSLKRPIHTGRIAASILTAAGMTDWIAESKETFLERALRQTADLESLSTLRMSLRSRLRLTPIGNPRAYAQAVETEYRKLWHGWCARQAGA